jgi:hypothetical protein
VLPRRDHSFQGSAKVFQHRRTSSAALIAIGVVYIVARHADESYIHPDHDPLGCHQRRLGAS